MDTSLAVGVGPRYLASGLEFQAAIGQAETKREHCGRNLRLGGEYFHASPAQINENALNLSTVGQGKLDWRLHRDSNRATAFATQQRGCRAQSGSSDRFGHRFVEDKMCPF